jgi:hypothetical protein
MNYKAFPQQVGLLGYSDPPHLPSHHRQGESDSFQPVILAFDLWGSSSIALVPTELLTMVP